MMLDTPDEIRKKQSEIILSKTPSERAMMGIDMCDAVYMIVRNSIVEKNPDFTKGEIVAAIFRRYYSDCFSEEELIRISGSIRNFHDEKSSSEANTN